MDIEEINGSQVMHIDTSCKLHEKRTTGIAFRIIDTKKHKGLALTSDLKKDLRKHLNIERDYARIYAICIYFLIKEDLKNFDMLVICGDEDFKKVKEYLRSLFRYSYEFKKKHIISISKLRQLMGKRKLKSGADNDANSYRKRSLKSITKQQEGKKINPIKVDYKMIKEMWKNLENKNKGGE